jgi:hypothetical protein
MKMKTFWDFAPCSLVEVYRRFRGACCLHSQGDETSVNFYETTRRNIPEDYCLPFWDVEIIWIFYDYVSGFWIIFVKSRFVAGIVFRHISMPYKKVIFWWLEDVALIRLLTDFIMFGMEVFKLNSAFKTAWLCRDWRKLTIFVLFFITLLK